MSVFGRLNLEKTYPAFFPRRPKQILHGNEVSLKQGMTVIIIIFAIVIIIIEILIAMVLNFRLQCNCTSSGRQ